MSAKAISNYAIVPIRLKPHPDTTKTHAGWLPSLITNFPLSELAALRSMVDSLGAFTYPEAKASGR